MVGRETAEVWVAVVLPDEVARHEIGCFEAKREWDMNVRLKRGGRGCRASSGASAPESSVVDL